MHSQHICHPPLGCRYVQGKIFPGVVNVNHPTTIIIILFSCNITPFNQSCLPPRVKIDVKTHVNWYNGKVQLSVYLEPHFGGFNFCKSMIWYISMPIKSCDRVLPFYLSNLIAYLEFHVTFTPHFYFMLCISVWSENILDILMKFLLLFVRHISCF